MRNRPKRAKPVLLCPQCGSSRILPVAGMIIGQVYHCQKCDYVGSLVFETDADALTEPPPD
jgi:transposase-like protein